MAAAVVAATGPLVCERRQHMTRNDEPRSELDASTTTDDRYAGFGIEAGYILYDTENQAAWVQSDTTHTLEEMV